MNKNEKHIVPQSLLEKVEELMVQQNSDWPLAKQNYAGLKKVKSKKFDFGYFQIQVQFNPERIRSSAAKLDSKTLAERPCFLCEKNSPPEQKNINYRGKFSIRINPFPIFDRHLTISLLKHVSQEIEPHFSDMLELAEQLSDFTIFYNGPKCGASAPDHFHFQAVEKRQLPVERELDNLPDQFVETTIKNDSLQILAVSGKYLRKVLVLRSSSEKQMKEAFQKTLDILKERGQDGEPMMNVVCNFEDGQWKVFLFPRDLQRPLQYFEKGDKQLVMSPASVEMGGLVILPRKEDFAKINSTDLVDIYGQVTINDQDYKIVIEKLKK